MTKADAYQLLGTTDGSDRPVVEELYRLRKVDLEYLLQRAVTQRQREAYRQQLEQVDDAYLTVSGKDPANRKEKSVGTTPSLSPVYTPQLPLRRAETVESIESESSTKASDIPRPKAHSSLTPLVIISGILLLVLIIIGISGPVHSTGSAVPATAISAYRNGQYGISFEVLETYLVQNPTNEEAWLGYFLCGVAMGYSNLTMPLNKKDTLGARCFLEGIRHFAAGDFAQARSNLLIARRRDRFFGNQLLLAATNHNIRRRAEASGQKYESKKVLAELNACSSAELSSPFLADLKASIIAGERGGH